METRNFTPLKSESFNPLPDEVVKKLSWDQKVLYRHVQAVQSGVISPQLARVEIGPLCHARWITFQSRILRLFMTAGVPSNLLPKLRKLACYIINIYFPMHMDIKYHSSIVYGAVNLFNEINLVKKHVKSKFDRELILSNIQVNGYFAHPHNILISKLGDEDFNVRKEAIDLINDVRKFEDNSLEYILPKIDLTAESYSDLCTIEKVNGRWMFLNSLGSLSPVTEPPLIKGLDLSVFLTHPFTSGLPCHTQSVERLVKVTTDASKAVCGRVNQSAEGMLVLKARKE